eukprot:UN30595
MEKDFEELKKLEEQAFKDVQVAASNYELGSKDFLNAMANVDAKISSHLKPSFQGFCKAIKDSQSEVTTRKTSSKTSSADDKEYYSEKGSEKSGSEVLVEPTVMSNSENGDSNEP